MDKVRGPKPEALEQPKTGSYNDAAPAAYQR